MSNEQRESIKGERGQETGCGRQTHFHLAKWIWTHSANSFWFCRKSFPPEWKCQNENELISQWKWNESWRLGTQNESRKMIPDSFCRMKMKMSKWVRLRRKSFSFYRKSFSFCRKSFPKWKWVCRHHPVEFIPWNTVTLDCTQLISILKMTFCKMKMTFCGMKMKMCHSRFILVLSFSGKWLSVKWKWKCQNENELISQWKWNESRRLSTQNDFCKMSPDSFYKMKMKIAKWFQNESKVIFIAKMKWKWVCRPHPVRGRRLRSAGMLLRHACFVG